MLFLYIVFFCFLSETVTLSNLEAEVEQQCLQVCPFQNRTNVGYYDYTCDYGCTIKQCNSGCKVWRKNRNQTCQQSCNGASGQLTHKELHCVISCNDAVSKYLKLLRVKFGALPAPALVADSLNATNLKLEWNFPGAKKGGLDIHVQWKYEDLSGSWQYCRNVTWNPEGTIAHIDNLQSYTKYREVAPENNFYIFRNLISSRNYTVAVSMRNNVGHGPFAKRSVSTPEEPIVKHIQEPVLIIATENSILEQGTHVLDEPTVLYNTSAEIRGLAMHIRKRLLFISDSNGFVSRVSLDSGTSKFILGPERINFFPIDLSVDWLNDQLYILGEVSTNEKWHIVRCDLNGDGLTVALAGLQPKPSMFEIDPYNGYLFWSVQNYANGGLYRLDITDISNGIKYEVKPKKILNETQLGAFIVDYANFRLLVSYRLQNTIKAVSFDGKEVTDLRPKVTKSKLRKVLSLATANKKFYWTDGSLIYYEDYHNSCECYFHNSYPGLLARSYKKVVINLLTSQPMPIPVNPPTKMQAIFRKNTAKTDWQAPHILGIQGKGAWQNWSYEIQVKQSENNAVFSHKNISSTSYVIENLHMNTEYIMKVAAYTSFGRSPWSTEFRGVTLNDSKEPIILWSAEEGLFKSNADGTDVETIIHKSEMRNYYYKDIAWFKESLILLTNNSDVFLHNIKTQTSTKLIYKESIGSIAVDWLGKKLYWSNPIRQLIIRGSFDGTQQEPLPISTLAKEIKIDSIKAYLYWSTPYAVECAHLNGANRTEYYSTQWDSGKQVMGITLDFDTKLIYWIVRGPDGSDLFRDSMAGYLSSDTIYEKVSTLQKISMQGSLCYFQKRLLWLADDTNAAISDLNGKNVAIINEKNTWGLKMLHLIDFSVRLSTDTNQLTEEIDVIPNEIDGSTVSVIGTSESFDITWDPVQNINFGKVFYEVHISNSSTINDSKVVTENPYIRYWRVIAPFTKIEVAIRAFTYWAASSQVRVNISSPESFPSAPENARTFVLHEHRHQTFNLEQPVTVIFRWDTPAKPNGVLVGYKMFCWYEESDERIYLYRGLIVPPDDSEHVANDLLQFRIYHFQIQAFTSVGDGEMSRTIRVDASTENPIPTLLVASTDSVFIEDIDNHRNFSLTQSEISPTRLSYIIDEKRLFWVNNMHELMSYDIDKSKSVKIFDSIYDISCISADWLERSVYYTAKSKSGTGTSINKVDLNLLEKRLPSEVKILKTEATISHIEVSPFTKKIYWTETSDGVGHNIMESYTDGSKKKLFFAEATSLSINSTLNKYCNCSDINVKPSFSIDHSHPQVMPLFIFINNLTGEVLRTDKYGCVCYYIRDDSKFVNNFSPKKFTVDSNYFYWTNANENMVYSLSRNRSTIVASNIQVNDILIFGQHMQPYPVSKCLIPKHDETMTPILKSKSSTNVTLQMPKFQIHEGCENFSLATVKYDVYYTKYNRNNHKCSFNNCQRKETYRDQFVITNLIPFTKYVVAISVSNYFNENEDVLISHSIVFQTAPGAPSKPLNVSAFVLNPNLVRVLWLPPQKLNGLKVRYEIHWKSEGALVRQKGEQPVIGSKYFENSTYLLTDLLYNLLPNETYTVWIRAYSETNTSSDSSAIKVTTFPQPSDIELINRTAYNLALAWKIDQHIEKYLIEFTPITSSVWTAVEAITQSEDEVWMEVEGLKPKTQYKFRLLLLYYRNPEFYTWPADSQFTFETMGDRPSPPGTPVIQFLSRNVYKIWWEPSKDNGSPIEYYLLEGLKFPHYRLKRHTERPAWFNTSPSIEEVEHLWETFYNGTETSWIIDGLEDKFKYSFRVSARNSFGLSEPSMESLQFDLMEAARMAEKQSPMNLIVLAICGPIVICLAVMLCFTYAKCGKQEKVQMVALPKNAADVELATLRELPRGIQNTNLLYGISPPTANGAVLLPHIRREQITLTNFLGSGAFGEVYEGLAKGINKNKRETRVAVKALRKGATDQEKSEFLQEAELMSHFKHEHILQLLGVCLDNDPHFIIMELMLGGDLLTYLRSSRSTAALTIKLKKIDLLKMCVDVAKGCRHLEEMHFVHRDLAARNCLVSSTDANTRIVKIGDFGLARDIYKNDYYRKEGEGLLPVRWMAPEALVDGLFTNQSDVWAFGILLWEIMTLGQQPYPARNNLEVLHYVRTGGRLGKPNNCPARLHHLMLNCWEIVPEKRPTFKYCLEVLQELHEEHMNSLETEDHYIACLPASVPRKSREDQGDDKEKNTLLSDEDRSTEQDCLEDMPKYLELICNSPLQNDGYEIPKELVKK